MRKLRRIYFLGFIFFVLAVLGLGVALFLLQNNQDLRGSAWGGILWRPGLFTESSEHQQPTPPDVSNSKTAVLFHQLTKTYWDAEVANVDLPAYDLRGVVFESYDSELDKSFVFSRIENFPFDASRPLRIWLEDANGQYVKAGLGEFVTEEDRIALYVASSLEGNIENYQVVHFSYDDSVAQLEPTAPLLSLAIHDGERPE